MNTQQEIRVLYVEDDEDDFFLAREFLDDIAMGTYDIEWASTYESGWKRVQQQAHDVYLIDFRLGQHSGLELIEAARASGLDRPIILLTGLGDREIDIAAMQAGADDYLAKDEINSSFLERAIRYTLNKYEVSKRLRESEERLQDFVETASDWIWEIDANFRYTSISGNGLQAGLEFYSETMINKRIWDTEWSGASATKWVAQQAVFEAHEPFFNFEYPVSLPNLPKGFLQINGKPVFDADGNFLGYRGTGRNITSEREMELQLHQAQKMDAIGQLTGGIAHDFNNILHVVSSTLELIGVIVEDNPRLSQKIEMVMSAIQRGAHLTGQLLAFSRRQTLNSVACTANTIIQDTLKLLGRTIREDIEIKTELDDAIPSIYVDTGMLGNALLNLSVNARDSMENGGTLTIKTAVTDLYKVMFEGSGGAISGRFVVISLTDTGEGIAKENLSKVFEPFFTTKEVGKGTGLGLSMVYGFVTQSNGYMNIASEPGKGTTVELYFPVSTATVGAMTEEQLSKDSIAPKGWGTVLLVEDDEQVRSVTSMMLEGLGYEVLQAENGRRAYEILEHHVDNKFDIKLVLSDVVMPGGISGIDLADKLKNSHPNIKVILASGYPDGEINSNNSTGDLRSKLQILRKPYSISTLGKALQDALEHS